MERDRLQLVYEGAELELDQVLQDLRAELVEAALVLREDTGPAAPLVSTILEVHSGRVQRAAYSVAYWFSRWLRAGGAVVVPQLGDSDDLPI